MRIRWIVFAAALVASIGTGVAWAAIPGSDSSAAPTAAGGAPTVPQVFETFYKKGGTLATSGRPFTVVLSLPAGTFDVEAVAAFNAWDIHAYGNGVLKAFAMSVRCTFDSPGRESLSDGASPVQTGDFTVSDHATISLSSAATVTYSCRPGDAASGPGDLVSASILQARLSATKVSDAAAAATITTQQSSTGLSAQKQLSVTQIGARLAASDATDAKRLGEILSHVKQLRPLRR